MYFIICRARLQLFILAVCHSSTCARVESLHLSMGNGMHVHHIIHKPLVIGTVLSRLCLHVTSQLRSSCSGPPEPEFLLYWLWIPFQKILYPTKITERGFKIRDLTCYANKCLNNCFIINILFFSRPHIKSSWLFFQLCPRSTGTWCW